MEVRGQPFLLPCLGLGLSCGFVCMWQASWPVSSWPLSPLSFQGCCDYRHACLWALRSELRLSGLCSELLKHLTLLEWEFGVVGFLFICFFFFWLLNIMLPFNHPRLSFPSKRELQPKKGFEDSDRSLGRKTRNSCYDSRLPVPRGLLDKD